MEALWKHAGHVEQICDCGGTATKCFAPDSRLGRICLNQAGINRHALATDKTFRDAPGNGRFKQMAQQIALTETPVDPLQIASQQQSLR